VPCYPRSADDHSRICVCRPRERGFGGVGGLNQLGQTEVENLDPAIACHEQILRLEIAMDDPALVRGREPGGDLERVVNRLPQRQRWPAQVLAEGGALEELGHEERGAAVRPKIVDDKHVRVVERAGRTRFLLESAEPVSVC
jgi:hypothetical protein